MRSWQWSKPHGTSIAVLVVGLLGAGWALAQFRPVLHERFEPDPKEDLELGVRVTAAGLPAAVSGPSGTVSLPDPKRPVDRKEPIYDERQSTGPRPYAIDRNTSDPGRLNYHEPFRPSIAPFKRTHVLDAVTAAFELVSSNPRPRPVTVGGSPGSLDDQFFGEMVVQLVPGEMIRIPSAGPHMAVYSAHLEPEVPFGFYVDHAENWFVRAPEGRDRMRLVMHVGVPRASFDGRIEATSYSALVSELPQVPANVERVTSALLQHIGVSRVFAPADALGHLVTYFRGFAASTERPAATQGEALYRELVVARKGVCRHRAFAFVVTSLGLGIPARFVHNEAHAWVEVFGGIHWHRVDLGGAASGIDYRGEPPQGPPHRPPAEAFQWPKRAQAAEQSLPSLRSSPSSGNQPAEPATSLSSTSPVASGMPGTIPSAGSATMSPPLSTSQVPAAVSGNTDPIRAPGHSKILVTQVTPAGILRGRDLSLLGRVQSSVGRCALVRIDALFRRQGRSFSLGAFATDEVGRFNTKLAVPAELPVGTYELVLSTPGTKDCPPASTE